MADSSANAVPPADAMMAAMMGQMMAATIAASEASSSSSEVKEEKQSADAPAAAASSSAAAEAAPSEPVDPEFEARLARILSIGEECIQPEELRNLLKKKPMPVAYDGFEPSGRVHIAQGVMKALNVNKLTSSGCKFIFWVADWFALMNNKMGGDIKKIKTVGRYMIEVWKAAGMDLSNVEFMWSSDEIIKRGNEYWPIVLDIARRTNLARIMRCCTIMGRTEKDELSSAQIMYPCMQCADIFFLKADICQLGMDQRKVNMLAREYCDDAKIKNKPIILSHHMLMGMKEGQEKMSKSDPDSAIFMEDSEMEVNAKIKKAFCPPGQVEKNPCLEYIKYIIIPKLGRFDIQRKESDGGNKSFETYEEVEADFVAGSLHPGDLKPALARSINTILQPVRDHFVQNKEAADLLKQVKSFKTTR